MKIVICGSMNKNGENMEKWAKHLRLYGHNVIEPHDVPYPSTHESYEKSENRKYYYEFIDSADLVLVCNDVDYIGFETACEVGYALKAEKRLAFTQYSKIDGIRALIDDLTAELWEFPPPEFWNREDYLREQLRRANEEAGVTRDKQP